jgi:hypothetical protein
MKNRRLHAQEYQDGRVAVVLFLEVGSPLLGGSSSDRVPTSKAGLSLLRQPRSESKIVKTIGLTLSDFQYHERLFRTVNVPSRQFSIFMS